MSCFFFGFTCMGHFVLFCNFFFLIKFCSSLRPIFKIIRFLFSEKAGFVCMFFSNRMPLKDKLTNNHGVYVSCFSCFVMKKCHDI